MDKKESIPYLFLPALKVNQPLGDFYVIKINAQELLSISFSEPMKYTDEFGKVKGSQRPKDEKRLKEIAKYIDSVEMAFPNSIILAANYNQQGIISKDKNERWEVIENKECGIFQIKIPQKNKLAAIIDGQHRLSAFEFVKNSERFSDLQLVCSVYFDLPNSYQAFLFATINSNQKRVDRSLALEQFGFNVDDEPENAWTPEKFAVFLSRKLNIDKNAPTFYKHIKVAPLNPENLFKEGLGNSWIVSTATVVDGIVSLISSNAKRDRIEMQQKSLFTGRHREMLLKISDYSPMRKLFIEGKDQSIYDTVLNYFTAVKNNLWIHSNDKSYITKTVGVQASFDILKLILNKEISASPESINFNTYLAKAKSIDFSDRFFQASGIGRSRIKNSIGIASGLISKEKIKKNDLQYYEELLLNKNSSFQVEKFLWEEDAENAINNTLENAIWNYAKKNVELFLNGDYEIPKTFNTYDMFFSKLVQVAEEAFITSLPSDKEFAEMQIEKFDSEDLVQSSLRNYESNLKLLEWI